MKTEKTTYYIRKTNDSMFHKEDYLGGVFWYDHTFSVWRPSCWRRKNLRTLSREITNEEFNSYLMLKELSK